MLSKLNYIKNIGCALELFTIVIRLVGVNFRPKVKMTYADVITKLKQIMRFTYRICSHLAENKDLLIAYFDH